MSEQVVQSRLNKYSGTVQFLFMLFLLVPSLAWAIEWPQQVDAKEGTIVVYQPQPESLVGNVLSGRAAMSLMLKSQQDPIFGVFWFTAKLDTDTDRGIATVRSMQVDKVNWPDASDDKQQRFTDVIEHAIPDTGFTLSLERLSASLATAEKEQKSLDNLNTEAPHIEFSEELAVLLLYDGEAKFSNVEKSDYERALNTPLLVVHKQESKDYYLSSGVLWYQAEKPMGPWQSIGSPPKDLVKLLPAPDKNLSAPAKPPLIISANKPTELVSTDGKPNWKTLPGGQLLYVENTETPWLRDLTTGKMYLLLSGRWYSAKAESDSWVFVRPDQLPTSFKSIPPDSDIGGLRVSVAGTEEAEQAVLDAQIPQTTAVKRSEATLTVSYDGGPKFEKIPNTTVSYAVNTGAQVLLIDKKYYAVDNGVWFASDKPTGPWAVADIIPQDDIAKIPPDSPVYNTTFVTVYDSTPEVVYVGYTPGYLWSFPFYGVPVYGTGYYYPPYWGRYYYPRPPTWGFHVGYNPWTGWNYGVSWSDGFMSFGASWGGGWHGPYRPWGCCGGWYGGGYHNRPVVINSRNINTGNINIGNSVSIGNRTTIGNKISNSPQFAQNKINNIYQRPENRNRNADVATTKQNLKQARSTKQFDNNVFADQHGNVAKRVGDDWQVRDNGEWKTDVEGVKDKLSDNGLALPDTAKQRINDATANRDINRGVSTPSRTYSLPNSSMGSRPALDRGNLNHSFNARQRGTAREMRMPARRR